MTATVAVAPALTLADRLRRTAARLRTVAVGAVNYDEIFILPGRMRDDGAAHVSEKRLVAGGHAANCASALVRLGFDTSVAGAVGNDPMGRWLTEDLRMRGIDVSRIATVNAPTGHAIIPVFENGHFMILERGANEGATKLPDDLFSKFGVIALFDPAVEMLEALADRLAKVESAPDIYWTPGGYYVDHPIVRRLLPHLRAVFLNSAEASDLRRSHGVAELATSGTLIVETKGADGATCHVAGTEIHKQGFVTDCVDPTGAGDHFAACFMLADQARLALQDCLAIGNLGGMVAVETIGARAENFGIERIVAEISARGMAG